MFQNSMASTKEEVNQFQARWLKTLLRRDWERAWCNTYLKQRKVMSVNPKPSIETRHPIKLKIFKLNELSCFCSGSSINAKFVKCVHLHVILFESCASIVEQPSDDHVP